MPTRGIGIRKPALVWIDTGKVSGDAFPHGGPEGAVPCRRRSQPPLVHLQRLLLAGLNFKTLPEFRQRLKADQAACRTLEDHPEHRHLLDYRSSDVGIVEISPGNLKGYPNVSFAARAQTVQAEIFDDNRPTTKKTWFLAVSYGNG